MEGEPNGHPRIYPGGAFIVHYCSLCKSTLSLILKSIYMLQDESNLCHNDISH